MEALRRQANIRFLVEPASAPPPSPTDSTACHDEPPLGQLRLLHAGLVVIGAPADEMWRLLAKVALDGVHPGRRAVLDYLVSAPGVHTTASIAGHCRLTATPTRRHLQDLTAHGVLDLVVGDNPERWTTSEWLRENWWALNGSDPGSSDEGGGRPPDRPPVSFAGRPAGVIQHGTVVSYPIHAAACRCGSAVYDVAAFDDAARWLRGHLDMAHGSSSSRSICAASFYGNRRRGNAGREKSWPSSRSAGLTPTPPFRRAGGMMAQGAKGQGAKGRPGVTSMTTRTRIYVAHPMSRYGSRLHRSMSQRSRRDTPRCQAP
jgi:hypothetical protein